MTYRVKLVVSDIDGTILTTKHRVTAKLRDTVKNMCARNIPLVLASARAPQGIVPIAELLGIHDDPLVSYNGAFIFRIGSPSVPIRQIKSHPMAYEAVCSVLEAVKAVSPDFSLSVYARDKWFVEKEDKWIREESRITKFVPEKTSFKKLNENKTAEIHKLLLIGEKGEIQKLFNYLKEINLEGITFYLSKENYLEVVAATVSKESAVRELAEYYQLKPREILTIGDQFNDVPMLQAAGIGVAMGNAPEKVKKAANFVTTGNDDDGAAKALIKYVLKG
ncbi:hypothetical protein JCM15457_1579 [Liquorilactobacillus sucicola DSM 21376 = JCM 15457]|nr:HAD family hydrolase [Liquorilactobacillus sucicola]GAJ26641.1 hypothetical protein JCM15457_1579 [Liquorilactobacillus sucicola DSM 21376 = JCM 15457]